jgi:tetratricopeptide (TPR) repeat protein
LKPLEKAHAAEPKSVEVLRALAVLTTELNDLDKAIAYQVKLNQLGDRAAEVPYNLGIALFKADRAGDAEKAFRQALSLKPDFAEATLNLGHALKAMGQDAPAREYWEKALALKPELGHP